MITFTGPLRTIEPGTPLVLPIGVPADITEATIYIDVEPEHQLDAAVEVTIQASLPGGGNLVGTNWRGGLDEDGVPPPLRGWGRITGRSIELAAAAGGLHLTVTTIKSTALTMSGTLRTAAEVTASPPVDVE